MKNISANIRSLIARPTDHPLALVVVGLLLVVALTPLPANAGVPAFFAQYIILPLAQFLGGLTLTLIGILLEILKYNDFIYAPAVVKGWVVVRDVVNMFFIITLLTIAFGTVFRMEQYQYNHILGKLLTMAVLVNFSKSIAGFFIDFAQVIMLTFVNGFHDAAAGNFINGFHLDQMFQFAKNANPPSGINESTFFSAALLALITIAIATVVIAVYVIIFILRIVALWFLVIISPLAFLANAWPGKGHEYHEQWWDYFGKYVSTGPILAFFLWLSLAVMQFSSGALGDFSIKSSGPEGLLNIPPAAITGIGQSDILLSFIISIIMLVGGLWMASKLGVAGGQLAAGALHKMQTAGSAIARGTALAPFKAIGAGAKWGERELFARTGIGLNPMRAVRAVRSYMERTREEKEKIGAYRGGKRAEQLAAGDKEKGIKSKPRRAALQMLSAAPEDFAESYLGLRGLKRLGRTFLPQKLGGYATGQAAFEDAEQARHARKLELARAQAKRGADDYESSGRLQAESIVRESFNQEAIDKARVEREAGRNLEYTTREVEGEMEVPVLDAAGNPVLDKKGKPTTKKAKKRQTIDEALAEQGLSTDLIRLAKPGERTLMMKKRKEFTKKWDKDRAAEQIGKDKTFEQRVSQVIKDNYTSDKLKALGKESLKRQQNDLQAKIAGLKAGGLSDDQLIQRNAHEERLLQQLIDVNKQILGETDAAKIATLESIKTGLATQYRDLRNPDGSFKLTAAERDGNKAANIKEIKELEVKEATISGSLLDESNVADKAKIAEALERAEDYSKKIERYEVVQPAYYASRDFRHLEHEEYSKLPQEPMEWTELGELVEKATEDHDMLKEHALLKKAAYDYNDNEVWNAYNYGSGPEGAEKFRQEHLEPWMGKQASMSLMNEINYINENLGHTNVSRMYGVKGGAFYVKTPAEQAASAVTEILKKNARNFFQNSNRLAYGYEDAEGKYHLDLVGKLTIAAAQDDFVYRLGRAEMNNSLLLKLTEDIGALRDMERQGILTAKVTDGIYKGKTITETLEAIRTIIGARGVGSNYDGLMKLAGRV